MSDFVKLGKKYNFHSLYCDISQAIGHRELILTCIPTGYFDILTSRKNVTLTFRVKDQGHRAKALRLQTVFYKLLIKKILNYGFVHNTISQPHTKAKWDVRR